MKNQILIIVFSFISILILAIGTRKSNVAVTNKPVDTWAIIDREFVEFTEEELEWRKQYVK